MAATLEEVKVLRDTYKTVYDDRHSAFKKLRRYWEGEYWQLAKEGSGERSISTIFRDLGRHTGAPPMNVEVVHNVIQQVCVKYQTFLAPLPMIRMYVDPPESSNRKRQAVDKERFLYGAWANGRMSKRFREIGWFLPLMGDAFLGCYPDYDRHLAVPILRSPEVTFPIPAFGGGDTETYVFNWQERESVVAATFPQFTRASDREHSKIGPWGRRKRGQDSDPKTEIFEFSDNDEFSRWAGTQQVTQAEHNFGFNLFGHAKFIEVPGKIWGHGAVEQAVNLNEVENLLYSMLVAAVYENVFPSLVLTKPDAAPEEIIKGPGSVIPLQEGGTATYLTPPVQALPVQMGFLNATRQSILQAASMSNVDFGESPVSSILTGAAVNELQGAGTGSTVEMVQGSLGLEVSVWNEKCGVIQQTLFRNDTVTLYSSRLEHIADLTAKQGSITVRGKELIGGWHNEVIFNPAMSQHDKLVMWLQAKGGGLVSDQYILAQVGIPDAQAMREEIVTEQIEAAVIGFVLQSLTDPQQQPEVEKEALAVIDGGVVRAGKPLGGVPPAPGPQQAPPPGGGAPPQGIPLGGGGVAAAPPLGLPPGAPQQNGPAAVAPPPPPQAATGRAVPLQVAQHQLGQAHINGRAWLIGEIVATGTAQNVEVAVTDPADRQTLADAAKFPVQFHVVQGEPQEVSVEITAQTEPAAA